MRQILTESLVLGVAGGVAGVALAVATVPFLRRLVPTALATWSDPQINGPTLIFVFLLSILAALLFGALPAMILTRGDSATDLQQGGRAAIGGGARPS